MVTGVLDLRLGGTLRAVEKCGEGRIGNWERRIMSRIKETLQLGTSYFRFLSTLLCQVE
jgi:hypothetical protein